MPLTTSERERRLLWPLPWTTRLRSTRCGAMRIHCRAASATTTRCCELVGDARFVLLGEASHGTHEFYGERARDHAPADRGVAASTPWRSKATGPMRYRVNRFVRGAGDDRDAAARRWPASSVFRTWMWRNTDMRGVRRLAARVQPAAQPRTGASASTASTCTACTRRWSRCCDYLDRIDPAAAERARERYACFDHFGDDTQRYGLLAGLDADGLVRAARCRPAGRAAAPRPRSASHDPYDVEAAFDAEQNARLVNNAEAYYR